MKTILLITNTESPPFTAIKTNMLPLAKNRGWAIHVFAVGGMQISAPALVHEWNPDGCIVYAARPYGLGGNFGKWRKPVVTMNSPHPQRGITSISHDSQVTGALAARHLLSLGLDNFAFFASPPHQTWSQNRLKSYVAELSQLGRTVIKYTGGSIGHWLATLPKPCGLFAANDLMAERIISEAFAHGIAIPNDIALVGCDDDPQICEHAEVTISSIRPDFLRCAELAVAAMECIMSGRPYTGSSIYGDIGVTRRTSSRPISCFSPQITAMLEHIRLNAHSGITTSDVLKLFPTSRRSAEDRFRKATGHSILEEIQSVRLVEVERLLSNPMVQIGTVASRTGYASENFLARLFKRTHGMTMSAWRKHKLTKSRSPSFQH